MSRNWSWNVYFAYATSCVSSPSLSPLTYLLTRLHRLLVPVPFPFHLPLPSGIKNTVRYVVRFTTVFNQIISNFVYLCVIWHYLIFPFERLTGDEIVADTKFVLRSGVFVFL